MKCNKTTCKTSEKTKASNKKQSGNCNKYKTKET